ncbi:hypothetical protein [Gaoshiqia sp. Z1-71]|uniref:hypothetical protein n=1 Tax=Gaoshiqia hydrogeniformans TaxID=3290090 RepID=UPI003BF78826
MRKIFEDDISIFWEEMINDYPVRHMRNKKTQRLWINIDDAFEAGGGSGKAEDWLKTDEGLDFLNVWKQEHPAIPFGFLFGRFEVPPKNNIYEI